MDYVKIEDIATNTNVRLDASEDLSELMQSIRNLGVLVPIIVYNVGGEWIVKDGHRRLEASRRLGMKTVPVVPVPAPRDEADIVRSQVAINEARKGLNIYDRSTAFQKLKDMGWSQKKIAKEFGISDTEVSQTLAFLQMAPKIKEAVMSNRLSISSVEPLLALDQADQERLADTAIKMKTVRNVRMLVAAEQGKVKKHDPNPKQSAVASDEDPLDVLAVSTVEDALHNIEAVSLADISSPKLKERGVLALSKLLEAAERLRQTVEA